MYIIICRSGYVSKDDNGSEWKEYESVKFGGKEVWNINNDADVQIPEYVIAYDMFEKTDNELVSWTIEDDYMQAEYWDGSYIKWDYEGNVLSDNTH